MAGAVGNTGIGGGRIADAGNRPALGSGGRQGDLAGNRGDRINGGNRINNGNRINTGDININNGWDNGWGGWVDHPVAAGVVAGAAIGATAAAIGSSYYALPAGCPPYYSGGYTYYSCGGAYYQPQYEGDQVVYVTVPDPAKG